MFIVLILAFLYWLYCYNELQKSKKRLLGCMSLGNSPISFEDQASLNDIADAKEATRNINCIELSVLSISPFNGKQYQMSACELEWLVDTRGWKEVTTITEVPQEETSNKKLGKVTVLAYSPVGLAN